MKGWFIVESKSRARASKATKQAHAPETRPASRTSHSDFGVPFARMATNARQTDRRRPLVVEVRKGAVSRDAEFGGQLGRRRFEHHRTPWPGGRCIDQLIFEGARRAPIAHHLAHELLDGSQICVGADQHRVHSNPVAFASV